MAFFSPGSAVILNTATATTEVAMRRTMISGFFNLLVLAAVAWGAWWAWQTFSGSGRGAAAPAEVLDIDKQCRVFADSGQCVCRHKRTEEHLSVPYDECVTLARKR
jgi:hypothetical protein